MPKVSSLIVDAMLKEAAETLERHGTEVSAELLKSGDGVILQLQSAPYTELTLKLARK
jgi:hypothetical protein